MRITNSGSNTNDRKKHHEQFHPVHFKIVAVSLMAAILVVVIGISARDFSVDGKTPVVVTKAGKSVNLSIKERSNSALNHVI